MRRKRNMRAGLLLLAAALLAGSIRAGEARALTLPEAVAVALDRNKDIAKAKEYKNLVLGRYIQERSAAFPHVTLSSGLTRASDESQNVMFEDFDFDFPTSQYLYSAGVEVSQALYTWGQVGAAIHAAKEGMADADVQLEIYRQAVVRDVSASFYDILLAKELLRLAKDTLRQKELHSEDAHKRFAEGVATDYDVLASDVDVENARPAIIRAENAIRVAQDRLAFLLGMDKRDVDAAGELAARPAQVPDFASCESVALANRPELKEIGHRVAIAKDLVKIYNAGDKPRLDFKGSFGWKEVWMGGMQGGGLTSSVGVYLTFPAYDGGYTKGKVIQAKSDEAQLGIEEAKLRDSIALQVRDALNQLREASEILKALGGTVAQAEKLLRMAETGYQYGVKTKLEVDDAQQNLNAARFNLAEARRNHIVAAITLDWVTGTLNMTDPAAP